MKTPSFKIKPEAGKFVILQRKAGENYFSRLPVSHFSRASAQAEIDKLKAAKP